jgi:hypothetical protein
MRFLAVQHACDCFHGFFCQNEYSLFRSNYYGIEFL